VKRELEGIVVDATGLVLVIGAVALGFAGCIHWASSRVSRSNVVTTVIPCLGLADRISPSWVEDIVRDQMSRCHGGGHMETEDGDDGAGMCLICAVKAAEEIRGWQKKENL
jgi:hypothetical protein